MGNIWDTRINELKAAAKAEYGTSIDEDVLCHVDTVLNAVYTTGNGTEYPRVGIFVDSSVVLLEWGSPKEVISVEICPSGYHLLFHLDVVNSPDQATDKGFFNIDSLIAALLPTLENSSFATKKDTDV